MTILCRKTKIKSAPKIASRLFASLAQNLKGRSEKRSKRPKFCHHNQLRPLPAVSQSFLNDQFLQTLKTALIMKQKKTTTKMEKASSRVTMSGQCRRLRARPEFCLHQSVIVRTHQNSNTWPILPALKTTSIVKCMLWTIGGPNSRWLPTSSFRSSPRTNRSMRSRVFLAASTLRRTLLLNWCAKSLSSCRGICAMFTTLKIRYVRKQAQSDFHAKSGGWKEKNTAS